MNVLVTGAFGNIGVSTLKELGRRGHKVSAFDVNTPANKKTAKKFVGEVEIFWGDLRNPDDLAAAVRNKDVVIHLAYVIPYLSVTGTKSEDRPDWAREINVGGSRNLINAILAQPEPPRLIFTSSLHVFGRTQDQLPPRRATDAVEPVEHYAQHKIETERMIRTSRLVWCIFRLGAALPIRLIIDRGMFEVPLDNRIEFVHSRDVAFALANALENEDVWGKTLLIGGGSECQFYYSELISQILYAAGLGDFPQKAFASIQYSTDWLDIEESQRLLNYQRHTLKDYIQELTSLLGNWRHVIRLFRPLARMWLLKQSPYYK
jgi:nucleoside-diphosphate-sugar epimerase